MRNFLIFGAIAFCLIMAIGYTPSEYHKQGECAKINQSEITALGDAIISGEIPPNTIEQKHKEYQTQRDFAATCSDLTAQWTVANLTWRGFMLGVIGMGLLGWTLIETRKASRSASDTLSIAEKTLAETIEANQRGQRAYLGIQSAYIVRFEKSHAIEIHLWIQNYGVSPAYLIEDYLGGGMFDVRNEQRSDGGISIDEILSRNSITHQSPNIINAKAKRLFVFTCEERIDEAYAGFVFRHNLYTVAGKFIYRDIFNRTYEFIFRGSVIPFKTEQNSSLQYDEEREADID